MFSGSDCVQCSAGTYYSSDGSCQSCLEGCNTCLDGNGCTSCKSGYTQVGSQCTTSTGGGGGNSCSKGKYPSSGNCIGMCSE